MSTNPQCMDQQLRRDIDTRIAKLVSPAILEFISIKPLVPTVRYEHESCAAHRRFPLPCRARHHETSE
jgi:hypothetical protein